MDGELSDQHKNTTQEGWTDRELNDWHKITTPDGWTDRELNGQHKNDPKKIDG